MGTATQLGLEDMIERRYLGLVELTRTVSVARDWKQLASAISTGLERAFAESPEEPPGVRLWAITAEGFEEAGRYPAFHEFGSCPPRDLRRAARSSGPVETQDGGALVGMHVGGVSLGVVEVNDPTADADLLAQAAPVIASRASLLAGQGVGEVLLAPVAIEAASDVASLMAAFAGEANRQLAHDRLSAYLVTCKGRAFERFAVATSPIVPGEGVVIPFEDLGLRHVVITNRALVSADLTTDQRVVGREDRVIAAAGFHGLLSVPLRVQGRPIGVLSFVSRTPGFYREEDIPIAQQIADQVAAFIDNLHAQQQMRALIRHEAAERERARVGRDVYHVVAQNIPLIAREVDALQDGMGSGDAEALGQQLARVRELAQGTLADVRRAIADLLPRETDAMSLEDAARATVAVLGPSDPTPRVEVHGDTTRVPAAARRAACRIMQEAVTNVRLHAGAKTLKITIECGRDLAVTVADNGVGCDPKQLASSGGLGLEHALERARALGGALTVESSAGEGTSVRFELLGVGDAGDGLTPSSVDVPETAAPNGSLRAFIVDRHPLMRAGLLHLAELVPEIRVVGEAGGVKEARGQLRRLRPDVVLLDGHLPLSDLEGLIHDLRTEQPLARVVITFDSDTGHEAALADAGASRFLHKTAGVAELADTVRAAASSGGGPPEELPSAIGRGTLSPRERSILLLMSAGRTNREIGQALFLATKTVERQVATIVRKLGARNRAHAAAIAVSRRIVDPEQAG
ncbi:MAG: LuxR C-terminal-related transcriptional regulator [Solirubrobacteraceae bacterium]